MMAHLVNHLWHSNREEIVAKSRLHCHARNLHSIMLLESPGKTIRLFFADRGHKMYWNFPTNFHHGLSIGFHPHHCELTLECVKGKFTNWSVEETHGPESFPIRKFVYESAITGRKAGFWPVDYTRVRTTQATVLRPFDSIYLPAHEVHTVGVATPTAAWLVYEGRENKDYEPICYSNVDLHNESFEGMYLPMPESKIEQVLKEVGLL